MADSSPAMPGRSESPPKLQAGTVWCLLIGIVILSAVLRLWRLDTVPPAINQDEAVHAYDAWSLSETGRDHDGAVWPIFFKAFGDYHPGPFVYLLVPFQAVFGLSTWSARLPGALVGTAAAPLAFFLMRRRYGDRVALAAALFTALSPWQMHISRLAFEAGICPTMILGGLVAMYAAARELVDGVGQSARTGRLLMAVLSGLLFGLASWTYHAMRVFIPLLLVGIVVAHRSAIFRRLQTPAGRTLLLVWLGGAAIGQTPFFAAWAIAPAQVWARAQAVSILEAPDGVMGILRNYFENLSPLFLFMQGDESVVQSVPGCGQLLLVAMLFVPLGIWRVLRSWGRDPFGRVLMFWILAAPVPAALADWRTGHSLRSIAGAPAFDLLSALGFGMMVTAMASRSAAAGRRTAIACGVLVTLSATYFLKKLFVEYPVEAAPVFQSEWAAVFEDVEAMKKDYDIVVLSTTNTNQLGLLYLFWTKMDPAAYQASDHDIEPAGTVERIIRIGNVVFRPSVVLGPLATRMPPEYRLLVAERPEFSVPGTVLKKFHHPNGEEAVILYDVRAADIAPAASEPPTTSAAPDGTNTE